MSKHEQNRAEKRDRMVRAGLDAFSETGYENTTVSDIVRRAGMTPSTFYNYFRDKDALLVAILEQFSDRLAHALEAIGAESDTLDAYVRGACRGLMTGLAADKPLCTLLRRNLSLVRSSIDHAALVRLYAALRNDLTRFLGEQGDTARIDYAVAAFRATGLEVSLVLLDRLNDGGDAEQAAEFAATLLLDGMRGLAGASD